MHLGWEADAPRVVHSVLPQLVSSWAAGDSAAPAPRSTSAAAPQQPPLTVVLDPASSGVPAPAVVSPRPVKTPAKASSKPVVASNIAPFPYKDGSSTASGSASTAEERKSSSGAGPATRSGGSRAGSKRVSRKAVSARARDGGRARSAELQTACGYL